MIEKQDQLTDELLHHNSEDEVNDPLAEDSDSVDPLEDAKEVESELEDDEDSIEDQQIRKYTMETSKRSQIAITLDEEQLKNNKVKYILTPFDELRMKLCLPNEKLFKAFQTTITNNLEKHNKYQPSIKKMRVCSRLGLLLSFMILLIWVTMVYLSLWLNTIVLWNPASVMITFYMCWPLGGAITNIRRFIWKNATKWYKCKDLKKYIKDQNLLVYNPMGITLKYEPKAYWITFSFIDGSVFE